MKHKVLIVDDEADMLSTCKTALRKEGFDVALENKPRRALARIQAERFDLIVADIRMPGVSGLDLLRAAKDRDADLSVIIMTAYPEVETAIKALRAGAIDYLVKPFHPEDFKRRVRRALEERRLKGEHRLLARYVAKDFRPVDIIARSATMRGVLELVDRVAGTSTSVLIVGESGTGKELVARILHDKSGRKGHFVPVDCNAIPEHLLENEFFGHEKGAHKGALGSTPGLLEFSNGGTFFLDEIGALSIPMQAKLHRVLQEKRFRRVGGQEVREVDVRVIAATNKDLGMEVRTGRFHEELYGRLNVVTINVPPLRDRRSDIPFLIEHYLPRFSRELGKDIRALKDETLEVLMHYSWPGNIRELQNILQKAIVRCEGSALELEDLPESLAANPVGKDGGGSSFTELQNRLAAFEREFLESLLRQTRGNVTEAAKAGGLPVSNFYWYLKKHRIKPQSFRP